MATSKANDEVSLELQLVGIRQARVQTIRDTLRAENGDVASFISTITNLRDSIPAITLQGVDAPVRQQLDNILINVTNLVNTVDNVLNQLNQISVDLNAAST